jgi:hypothetical protein
VIFWPRCQVENTRKWDRLYVVEYVRDLAEAETDAEAKQVYDHVLERFNRLKNKRTAEPEAEKK